MKLFHFRDKGRQSGCSIISEIEDHQINTEMGILELNVVCGARKRDRARILLSAGAKTAMKRLLDGKVDYINVEFIKRENKIPKIILSNEESNEIMVLAELGSGFRGGLFDVEGRDKILVDVAACQAWGCGAISLYLLKPNERVVVMRTGRLYGDPPYIIFINDDGRLRTIYADDLSELEIEIDEVETQ